MGNPDLNAALSMADNNLTARANDLHQLLQRRAHAILIEGAPQQGQFELAFALAQSWLCETPLDTEQDKGHYCGVCESCHLVSRQSHPDLRFLAPETLMLDMGWPLSEKAQDELDKKKRKPSKEIRIDAMLSAIEFSQRTASRARGKVILVYPAEAMNTVTANALLKTLEEPPAGLRFVLASDASHQLLPTIRSRCQSHPLRWMEARPNTTPDWHALPKKLSAGQVQAFTGQSPAQAVQIALKVCHDAWMHKIGAPLRYFSPSDMPPPPLKQALATWHKMLFELAKTVEHPYKEELLLENLATQSSVYLNSR